MIKTAMLLAVLMCAVGCEKDGPPESGSDVFEVWRNAGFEVGSHEALEDHGLGEAKCQRGTVAGIETTVCSYDSEDAAKAAQEAGLQMVGNTTGASLPRGKVLLVVADRDKVDPSGKTINKLTKTFLGR